jgi:hypothetical protein
MFPTHRAEASFPVEEIVLHVHDDQSGAVGLRSPHCCSFPSISPCNVSGDDVYLTVPPRNPVSGSILLDAWQRPERGGAADPRLLTKTRRTWSVKRARDDTIYHDLLSRAR